MHHQAVLGDVVEEFAGDREGSPGQRDFHLAVLLDVLDVLLEEAGDMRGIGGGRDGDDGLGLGDLRGRGENGGAAE